MKKIYNLTIYHDGFERGATDNIEYRTKKEALYAFKWKKYEHQTLQLDLLIEDEDGNIIAQPTLRTSTNGKAKIWIR